MPRGIYLRTPEIRAKIAATLTGRQQTPEHITKSGDAARRNAANPEWHRRVSEGTRAGQAKMTPEERKTWNKNQSIVRIGTHPTVATREKLSKVGPHNWTGGKTADSFAAVLLPAGFIREHHLTYGEPSVPTSGGGLRRARYQMDFAHLAGKVNIELDGSHHKGTPEHDAKRDAILRDLGWKVIRIKHE